MRLFASRCFRSDILAGMLFGIASIGFVPCAAAASQPAFDPKPWLEDLAQAQEAVLASAPANEFPSGIVQVAGHRVGVLKIGLFSALGYPELCDAALAALNIKLTSPCNDECSDRIEKWASDRMTSDLAAQLSAIKVAAGAEVLLVDVADNGGGTEWAEAAARMVTAIRLKSERMGFVRGPHWAKHFSDTQADLRADAKGASPKDREMLIGLADQVQA